MQVHRFGFRGSDQPSYYVLNHCDNGSKAAESAFYHFDTPQEAVALFRYLLIEHPDWHLALGVHRDYTRRADIVEHVGGVTILVDDFRRICPWKDDSSVSDAAIETAHRLNIKWQVDRELADASVLVPYEPAGTALNPFFEDKALAPECPNKPLTSVHEAYLEGEGWIPIDELNQRARRCWYDMAARPKVTSLLVSYRANSTGFGASSSVTPAEFKILRQRYEVERRRERPESLDEAKLKARQRAANKNAARNYSEISSSNKRKDASL